MVGSIAIGMLPLLLLAAANLWRQVQEGEDRVIQDRIALARAAALTVSGFVDTSFATLQTLAVTPSLADPASRPELTGLLQRARQADSPLEVIGLFRPDGWNAALDGLNQPPLTVNVLDREYVQRARATGMRVVSPATIPKTTGVLTVDLVIPVDFVSGGRGVVSGSLALTRLGDQLRALPGSDSVQIVLVDANGQVILHPDPSVVRSVTSLSGTPEVDAVLGGRTGSQRGAAFNGADSVVAYAPVPGYAWGVLVVQPVDTAFALVRRDLVLALVVLGLILALAAAMGWLLGGKLSAAYAQLVGAKTRAEAAQARAELAQQQMAFLAEASRVLGSSLENKSTLERVAGMAVTILGDWCAIHLMDDAAQVSALASSQSRAGDDRGSDPFASHHGMAAEAARTGQAVHSDPSEQLTPSVLVAPVLAGDRSIGSIMFLRWGGGGYGQEDVELAQQLAHRVALAVENARLYHAAQQAVQVREEFLSVAAHELKTPITSLRGYAQLAARSANGDGPPTPRHIRKALEVIELQSGKLSRIVGQLLEFSRLEAGKLKLSLEEVDLVPVIEMLVERTQFMSGRHHLVLHAPPRATAVIDVLRFEQVITNLLDNAVKFSPHGGEVSVELKRLDEGALRLTVQDQGIGIPADKLSRIFERFYQAHDERLRAGFAGMGLGLYVSQQVVALHGGSIAAEPVAEGGTRIVVTLPTSPGAALDVGSDVTIAV